MIPNEKKSEIFISLAVLPNRLYVCAHTLSSHYNHNNSYSPKVSGAMLNTPSIAEARALLLKTPALSVGICIFSVLFNLFLSKDSKTLVLYPGTPLKLDLNTVSFYIFPHVNWIHLFVNLISLFPLLSVFERENGTIHTGITLNLLAVVTAIAYCIPGLLLYPEEGVAGLLAIFFSFLTYFCQKERAVTPVIFLFKIARHEVSVPTEYFQFVNLFVIAILIPSTSFFGHLAGIGAGYLLAFDYLRVLYPPLRIVQLIEVKLSGLILLINQIVNFILEEDALVKRGNGYSPILSTDLEASEEPQLYQPFERRVGE